MSSPDEKAQAIRPASDSSGRRTLGDEKMTRNMTSVIALTALLSIGLADPALADTHYVDPAGSDTSPYTTPGTAAHTIGAALSVATAGDTVSVATATYAETVALLGGTHDGLLLIGTGGSRPLVTSGMTLGSGLMAATVENMHFKGLSAGGSIVRMLGAVTDLTLENIVIDGSDPALLHGFAGGGLVGDVTVNNCEFVDIKNWAVFESNSGGGGTALDEVNFTNNVIMDCNGSVAFRGDTSSLPASNASFTTVVNIIGNTWDRIGQDPLIPSWAAFEIDRCKDANVYCNTINDVDIGLWGEGQPFQAWSCTSLDVRNNTFSDCEQGIWVARVDGSIPGDVGDTVAVFRNNNWSGNAFAIRSAPSLSAIDAEDNWWGDISGPEDVTGVSEASVGMCFPPATMLNADGLGDELFSFPAGTDIVDYCPWLTAPATSVLALTVTPCPDADPAPGKQLAIVLSMLDLQSISSGYSAFVDYDMSALAYRGDLSAYSATPFPTHLSPIAQADDGLLELSGTFSPGSGDSGTCADAVLATLLFDVLVTDCTPSFAAAEFEFGGAFPSELSYFGVPLVTSLTDPPPFILDPLPPVIVGTPADITQPSDAGACTGAIVTYTDPTATDNCDPSPTVVCVPASGSFFSVGTTTVTCTATDACGNASTSTFDVTVTATVAVDVIVHLVGSMPTTRCIKFVPDSCSSGASESLTFVGSSPAIATTTIEVPCGVWTQICAKDEQHTKWAESPLILSGTKYLATVPLVLDGGDTDNDGDCDINDVTLFLGQFGLFASPGGCPWDGVTRDTDFSNNGAVGSEDYAFLAANWLTTSGCSCYLPASTGGPGRHHTTLPIARVPVALRRRVDLDGNGVVDHRDVFLFESEHGLPHALSDAMRASTEIDKK